MTPRLLPSLALIAAVAAAGCVEQRESAPVVFRGTTPGGTGAPVQSGAAFPAAPVDAVPLDVAPPATAAADARGIVNYGGYSEIIAQPGDTLESMAARAGVSAAALASYNGIPAGWTPQPGRGLILPSAPPPSSVTPVAVAPLTGAGVAPAAPATPAPTPPAATPSTSGFDVAEIEAAIGGPTTPGAAAPTARAPAPTPEPAATPAPEPAPAPAAAAPETRTAAVAPAPAPAAPTPARLDRPVDGSISRPYSRAAGGARNDGVDFAAPAGAPVRAAADGQVALVSESLGGLGTIVLIRHAGELLTVYGRVDGVTVKKGDRVSRGQTIGAVAAGAGGAEPTMHFEVRRGPDPVDPADYLPG